MKYHLFLLLIILPISVVPTCNCGKKDCRIDYHFEVPVTVSPALDTFSIGDTIWISLDYDAESFLDLNSNSSIDVGDFDFNIDLNILRIDSLDGFALDHFELIQETGELTRLDLVDAVTSVIQFDIVGGLKRVEFALKPEMEGIYIFGFNSFYETGNRGEKVNLTTSGCSEYIEYFTFNKNSGATNNYDLYINTVTEPPYDEVSVEEYKNDGGYTFVVVQ